MLLAFPRGIGLPESQPHGATQARDRYMLFNPRGGSMARAVACTNVEVFVTAIRTHYLGYVNEPFVVPCLRSFGQRVHTHNDSSLCGGPVCLSALGVRQMTL